MDLVHVYFIAQLVKLKNNIEMNHADIGVVMS